MRTVSRDIGIFLSFGISFGLSFGFMGASASALERDGANAEAAGEVVSVHGTVYVRQEKDGQQQGVALRPAQNVYAGDIINTSSDGAIKILLKDKSIVDLGASSLFKVDGFKAKNGADREVDLDMKFGRLRVSVSKKLSNGGKFNVKTKAATMGVRGTEFVVNSALGDSRSGAQPKTDVTVLQGKVDVQAPTVRGPSQVKSLTAGGQISTAIGAAPVMKQLSTAQVSQMAAVNKVADNTFSKAVTIEAAPPSQSSTRAPASSAEGRAQPAGEAPVGSVANAVAEIAATAPTAPISITEIGVPGAPSVINVATNPVNQVNRSYRVTVIVGQ